MSQQSPVSPPAPTPVPPPKKKRGLFGFLFKTALGCTAFAIGSLIVFVLLLPTMVGGLVKSGATSTFAESYRGSIVVGEAHLAWFQEQRLTGIVLRDPEGHDVASASAVLPSLMALIQSGKTKIGRVELEVDAELVQDDHGITNLQRALEPRPGAKSTKVKTSTEPGFDALAWLAELDLDLVVKSQKLSWSDADTRRLGIPFEVRDLALEAKARPGAPITMHVAGRVVSEQPGALRIDATVHGPITSGKAWPFGKIDAQVEVDGFSSAMIDGIAGLQGNLKEVLGNHFALRLNATGVTPDAGDVELSLNAEHASIAVVGRFVDGVLRSTEKPGLVASFPAPRGFLAKYLTANLPPNQRLTIDADAANGAKPWSLRVSKFRAFPPPLGGLDHYDPVLALEGTDAEFEFDVPSRVTFENAATRKAGATLAMSSVHVSGSLAGQHEASLNVTAALDTGAPGEVRIDAKIDNPWAILHEHEVPVVNGRVELRGIKTAAVAAFVGEGERAQRALGGLLDVTFETRGASYDGGLVKLGVVGRDTANRFVLAADASIEKGVLRARINDKVALTWDAPTEWLTQQIAAFLPPGIEVTPIGGPGALTLEISKFSVPLPDPKGGDFSAALTSGTAGELWIHVAGANYVDETLRAAKTSLQVRNLDVNAKLAAGGAANLGVRGDIEQGSSKSKLVVDVATADAWRFTKPGALDNAPPVDARVVVTDLPTTLVDLFVGHEKLASRALGGKLSIGLDARNASLKSGTLRFEVTAPNATLLLAGKLDGGVFRASGTDELHATLQLPASVVAEEIAAFLPPESSLAWPSGKAEVRFFVRELALTLPDFAQAKAFDAKSMLAALAANVHVDVAAVGWSDAHTRAARLDASLRAIALDVAIAPKTPLTVKLGADVIAGKQGRLDVDASVRDPWSVLEPNGKLAPIVAHVKLSGLDTAVLDALASGTNATAGASSSPKPKAQGSTAASSTGGTLASLLGPELSLEVAAQDLSASGGSFHFDAKSETATLRASASMQNGTIVCAGEEGVDLTLKLKPAFVEQRSAEFLPANTRVRLAEGAGPLWVKVRDVRFALPSSAPATAVAASTPPKAGAVAAPSAEPDASLKSMLDQVSKLALKFEATLPALVYADAATDAAQRPVSLTDLHVTADIHPNALPSASITGRVVDEPPGEVTVKLDALDALSKLAEPHGLDTWRAKVSVKANQVPTAIVDLLAAQNGLLVEALGTRLEIAIDAPAIAMSAGTFNVDFHSDLHSVHAEGHLANRTIVIDKVDGLLAKVAIGPLMSQKVVGQLVPMLFNIEKAPGAEPAHFAVDDLHYPLDGDLSKLDGTVRIELGAVSYKLLPGLDDLLGDFGVAKNTTLPPLRVPIKQGVASYDKLPIKLGGRDVFFSGSYNLVTQSMKLTTSLPLKLLGKKAGAELESVRDLVDPETAVPIEISGTWKKPKFAIGEGFAEKLLEGAASKGLDGLLKGLGKKKKKD
jgi:hypothetical protein